MTTFFPNIPGSVWTAIVTAVFTSFMTLLGVRISNKSNLERLALQLAHEKEVKQEGLLRDRLEELYLSMHKYLNALFSHFLVYSQVMKGELTYNQALDVTIKSGDKGDFEPARITMIIDMYFPELQESFQELEEIREKLNDILHGHKLEYKAHGPGAGEEWLKLFQPRMKKLADIGDKLEKKIVNIRI